MFDLSDTVSLASFGPPKLAGSTQSLPQHSSTPELLVSLCYASLTGRLTVEVLKATNLRYLQMQRAPGKISNTFRWLLHNYAKQNPIFE